MSILVKVVIDIYIVKYFRSEFIIFLIPRRLKMSNWNIRVGWLGAPSMFSGTGWSWQEQSVYITTSPPPSLPEVTCEHFSSFKIINCRHSVCRAPPSHLPWLHHPRISPRHPDNPYPGSFLSHRPAPQRLSECLLSDLLTICSIFSRFLGDLTGIKQPFLKCFARVSLYLVTI